MPITSAAALAQARAALETRPASELADFILSLASSSDGIAEYVQAFVLATDPSAAAEVLHNELRFLCKGEPDSAYRHRKGAGHVARSERFLDSLERHVSPRDPLVVAAAHGVHRAQRTDFGTLLGR